MGRGPLLLRQAAGRGPKVAMWDHGRTYTWPQSRFEQSLKFALTRRACWFFAYTDGGARAVTAGKGPDWGLSLATPVIVKYRDSRTDTRTELEAWIR